MFEDCARADVVVSPHRAPAGCQAAVVLDRSALEQLGAASIRLHEGTATVKRARLAEENWPWTPSPPSRYRQPTRRLFNPSPAQTPERSLEAAAASAPGQTPQLLSEPHGEEPVEDAAALAN